MIIDSHVHLDSFSVKLSAEQMAFNLKKIMAKAGIAKSIVIPTTGTSCQDYVSTEKVLKIVEKEKSFLALGTINIIKNSREDFARLKELALDKKIIGVKLYPGYEPFYPNDERCDKIYDLCEDLKIPLVFHSGETDEKGAGIKYALPIHIDDVAIKRPKLKIVIAHMGNPWFDETRTILCRHDNIYADISGLVWLSFDKYWKAHYGNEIIKTIKWCDGENHLLFGTDWACIDKKFYYTINKQYIDFVKGLKITKKDKEKIFCKNAEEVFGI